MVIFQAIILGIVEGLTEFLPISSTGHLIVAQHLIGYKDAAELFTVVIQIGAIAAVMWFYRRDIWAKITGLFSNAPGARAFWRNLIIATVPAGLVGLAFDKKLQAYALPITVAISLIIGGVVLWLVEQYHHSSYVRSARGHDSVRLEAITPKQAATIGIAQIFSLVPGVSRSGSTIVGGLLSGLDRVTATTFSFYLAMPIMVLATGYKLAKEHSKIATLPGGSGALIVGTIAAFVTGLAAVSWLIGYISRNNFKIFAYYRVCIGVLIIILVAVGAISNSR